MLLFTDVLCTLHIPHLIIMVEAFNWHDPGDTGHKTFSAFRLNCYYCGCETLKVPKPTMAEGDAHCGACGKAARETDNNDITCHFC